MDACLKRNAIQWILYKIKDFKLLNPMKQIIRSCELCSKYRHEEIGDSDFGAKYADKATCADWNDTDKETEKLIPDFNRKYERSCCQLDFWAIAEIDDEINEIIICDSGDIAKAFEHFTKKYLSNDTEQQTN